MGKESYCLILTFVSKGPRKLFVKLKRQQKKEK